MTKTTKQRYLSLINQKQRMLTRDEAFDFYVENVMRNDVSCKWNPYPKTGPKYEDYALWELETKASQWHRMTIGSMVLQGSFKVSTN